MKTQKGFTLIELLVVIAIIALLAAILFPVFAKAREKARQTTCSSNEKQIGLGLLQYSQDYDETFPICWSEEYRANSAIIRSWDQALTPYNGFKSNFSSGSPVILACPDDGPRSSNFTPRSYALAGATNNYYNNYDQSATDIVADEAAQGFAGAVQSGLAGWHYQGGHQQSDILAPTSTLMLVELHGNLSGGGHPGDNGDAVCFRPGGYHGIYSPTCDTSGGACGQMTTILTQEPPHGGGFNYGFCDGHVKWYEPHQTVGATALSNYNSYCGNAASCNMHGLWTLDPTD